MFCLSNRREKGTKWASFGNTKPCTLFNRQTHLRGPSGGRRSQHSPPGLGRRGTGGRWEGGGPVFGYEGQLHGCLLPALPHHILNVLRLVHCLGNPLCAFRSAGLPNRVSCITILVSKAIQHKEVNNDIHVSQYNTSTHVSQYNTSIHVSQYNTSILYM